MFRVAKDLLNVVPHPMAQHLTLMGFALLLQRPIQLSLTDICSEACVVVVLFCVDFFSI
jgi:hypothetical protein